jgi:biopolymer transport protein ExbD
MGMGGGGGDSHGVRSDINITPLVDVLLVLLIIFMVMTPILLRVLMGTIPKKDDEDITMDIQAQQVVVKIGPEGELSVNDTPTTFDNLQNDVAEKVRTSRERIVFFDPDDAASWQNVAHAMDIVRGCHRDPMGELDVKIGIMTAH